MASETLNKVNSFSVTLFAKTSLSVGNYLGRLSPHYLYDLEEFFFLHGKRMEEMRDCLGLPSDIFPCKIGIQDDFYNTVDMQSLHEWRYLPVPDFMVY